MKQKRGKDEWFPIGDVFSGRGGPEQALQEASPQATYHFTRLDQVDQLVEAREDDPDMGFMARLMTLCSLPRTNPGNRLQYIRRNGPYTLGMTAGINNKLPYGNIPRLLLAWVCTEAVRTQVRELVLGRSLSEFMCKLGIAPVGGGTTGARTRLRNQMKRLFNTHVQLIYEDDQLSASVNSPVVSVCQKTPLSELSCHDPPHFPRQLQPNFVQEDASDRSGWGDWWWTGPDLRDAAIGRRSRLLGSGFKG